MSSLGSPNPFFIAGKKAYEIERSLRFNDDDGAYLQETAGTPTNNKIWTYSVWVKRTTLSGDQAILVGYSNGGSFDQILFSSSGGRDNQLFMQFNNSGTYGQFTSTRLFRDVGAWGHLVIKADTTAGSNGVTVYWNNEVVAGTWNVTLAQDATFHSLNQSGDIFRIGHLASGVANHYLDGYLAEINFVDGSALLPTSFGATDPITGQWNPRKYTGSYGTNGFYLNFSTDTLGTDRSGNSNDFTPNNFSVVAGAGNDALSDTPTNNFATMNPLVPSPTATWANGNLDLGGSSSTQYNQNNTSTFGVTSGKWYAEVKFTFGGTTNAYMGICPINAVANANMTGSITDAAVIRMDNTLFIEGSAPSSGTSISSGDIIGIALDMDNQKVWFSVQGTYVLSGNPSTGANATFDGITAGETIAICARPLNNTLNFNFGQRAFTYTPPTGFKTLCSANLPEPTIKLPNKHFDTLLWTGTAASHTLTGLNFQPDWFWAKSRSQAYHHTIMDSVRGSDRQLWSNRTNDEQTNTSFLTSFNSNGVTLGDNSSGTGATNTNGHTYVGWNWNAGDTDGKTYTVTVVSDSGNKYRFDGFGTSAVTLDLAEGGTYIFNYPSAHPFRFSTTSDGTHGGGTEYTTGVTVLSSTSVQIVVAASAPTLYYYCTIHSGMGGAINTNSTLGSSNFDGDIQTTVKVNSTAGFSIVSFADNYAAGSGAYGIGHGLGVKPALYIVRLRNATSSWWTWHQDFSNQAQDFLQINSSNAKNNNNLIWGNTAPNSTKFYLTEGYLNNVGDTAIAYCFSEVAGYSKFGKYTGNASTNGTFAFCGFKPAFVLLKKTNNTDNWTIFDNKRDIDNPMHHRLQTNLANAESTTLSSSQDQIDFLSNGFKLRSTSNNHNGNNSSNIFWAFAESPFKNARAR